MDFLNRYFEKIWSDIAGADTNLILLVILLVTAVIVLDTIGMVSKKLRKDSGIPVKSKPVALEGSNALPTRNYISDIQGIAGRPDAVIREMGYFIPVERKPFAKKVRDRHVAQLLVYMRLIEEFEGKKPPYGYLILGKSARRVQIFNTEQRQLWLQKHLDQMRLIVEGKVTAIADPIPSKCTRCPVRDSCTFKILS